MSICKACERHVYDVDRVCPFCGSAEPRLAAPGRLAGRHLSRTAAHAARAALLVSAVACGSSHELPDDGGDAMDSAVAEAGVRADAGATDDAAGIDAAGIDAAGIDAAGIDAAGIDAGDRDAAAADASMPDADAEVGVPIYGGVFPDPRKRAVV